MFGKILNTISVWWKAVVLDRRHWRVKYPDGQQTRLLHYSEAKPLQEIFGGQLYIDANSNKQSKQGE